MIRDNLPSDWRAEWSIFEGIVRAVAATLGTPHSQEGMAAFLEKRKPVFNQS